MSSLVDSNAQPVRRIVVFSCGDLGVEIATRIAELPGLERVFLFTSPYRTKKLSSWGKVKQVYRRQGLPGLISTAAQKFAAPFRSHSNETEGELNAPQGIEHQHFVDFHSAECLEELRAIAADFGVIAGTYILKPSVFAAPRLGCVNLHTGKVPAYRGAAPVFWELLNGEKEVGITIHRVEAAVDAGEIVLQEVFPLDPAPPGNPLQYVEEYRTKVLRPNGVRMMVEAVHQIVSGTARCVPQDTAAARTYKTPNYADIRELRRRVRQRRREKVV